MPERGANTAVFLVGVVLVAAAIVGGAVRGAGVEIPAIDSWEPQLGLGIFGVLVMAASMLLRFYDPRPHKTPRGSGETVEPSPVAAVSEPDLQSWIGRPPTLGAQFVGRSDAMEALAAAFEKTE